jgi:transcription elongation GreA/GreB family factor
MPPCPARAPGKARPIPGSKEVPVIDRNDVVLSARDAATLSAILASFSPREAPFPGAAEELSDVLEGAHVLTDDAVARDVVVLNAEVTYVELPGGARRTVRLVHPASADASNARISVFAPVGRALLGRRAGARVPVALPDSSIDELHVVDVAREGHA